MSVSYFKRFRMEIDLRGQFLLENIFPGTYEINAGIGVQMSEGRTQMIPGKKHEVVVTAGSSNNVTVTGHLKSAPPPRP